MKNGKTQSKTRRCALVMETMEFRKTDTERGNSMNPENKGKLKRILICDSYSVFNGTKT